MSSVLLKPSHGCKRTTAAVPHQDTAWVPEYIVGSTLALWPEGHDMSQALIL